MNDLRIDVVDNGFVVIEYVEAGLRTKRRVFETRESLRAFLLEYYTEPKNVMLDNITLTDSKP